MQAVVTFEKACEEISRGILVGGKMTEKAVRDEIIRVCTKYSLKQIPRNNEILATVNGENYKTLQKILIRKPVKTASGVAVIALMAKPFACPHGRCTYCPGGIEYNSPNSYTGNEPSTVSAIKNDYDPKMQILSKIEKLRAYGHDISKIELVIVGGTFLFMPEQYRYEFIKSCYDALNGHVSSDLTCAQEANVKSEHRNVGFTIETKPDYCRKEQIDVMLTYGITRVEIGVQSLQDHVLKRSNRGHGYKDIVKSFQEAKDSGYKITAHMMPGLPGSTPEMDLADFERLYSDSKFVPDMLKIYPTLVLRGTPLYDEYKAKTYKPYKEERMISLIAKAKSKIPKWVRIMRVQREISADEIIAGPKYGNLRQTVLRHMAENGIRCMCIRCREAGLSGKDSINGDLKLYRADYDSSGGREVFLSYEDADESVFGYLRLRMPSKDAHRPEITLNSCIVRELHVTGKTVRIGTRDGGIQHAGIGRDLLSKAESIAKEEFDCTKMLIISAVGTRGYYAKFGYRLDGPYMAKDMV
ncbi:MAG: tRNA uridine(34) 5-carboxymethylaminomethyl modification radical SAM/GNAT enzyme Elp3 [Cenarchaeum symbiont of Oopsacas minuta]|nr:tRNA uridine(34) 5-carboxymethylaminomethyl modification radical SAM/GNAT enzyme Elp3 [Cenarchaeum symbiont of Oopsacas minuta]